MILQHHRGKEDLEKQVLKSRSLEKYENNDLRISDQRVLLKRQ